MTSALEVEAIFTISGLRAVVALGLPSEVSADVFVADTETRHSSPAAAFEHMLEVIGSLTHTSFDFAYKKIGFDLEREYAGGDTAHAFVAAFENSLIILLGEVLPGVDMSRIIKRLPRLDCDLTFSF